MRRKWPLVLQKLFRSAVLDSILRRCTALSPVSSSFEWVAPLRRPLGTFHQQLCRHRDIVTANPKQRAILTACFPEEQVDGSPEEAGSLVTTRVQQ